MTTLIERETRLEAWIAGVEHLVERDFDFNVILSIAQPSSDGGTAKKVMEHVDKFLLGEPDDKDVYPLNTIAETIFPGSEYRRRGVEGVYTVYPEQTYPLIKSKWGTYAYRMVRRLDAQQNVIMEKDGSEPINPLKRLVNKMKTGDTKRGCFELGVSQDACDPVDIALHDDIVDGKKTMGAPCLSHLTFKKHDGRVFLTAMYRSHDYRLKVLGNLLGLARLQRFVAEQTGLAMGPLVVHSSYATLEGSKARVKKLLQDIREIQRSEDAQ